MEMKRVLRSLLAEFENPVECNGVVKETRKFELNKNSFEKFLDWFKKLFD